jgi:hypothetical protein
MLTPRGIVGRLERRQLLGGHDCRGRGLNFNPRAGVPVERRHSSELDKRSGGNLGALDDNRGAEGSASVAWQKMAINWAKQGENRSKRGTPKVFFKRSQLSLGVEFAALQLCLPIELGVRAQAEVGNARFKVSRPPRPFASSVFDVASQECRTFKATFAWSDGVPATAKRVDTQYELRLVGLADVDAAAAAVEVDLAVGEGIQRVVASLADVATGVPFGAALADQDISREHDFAAEFLDAKPLGARVAAVAA